MVAARERTGAGPAALGHEHDRLDGCPAEVELAAGLARAAGLGPEPSGNHPAADRSRPPELGAHEARVALALDVADDAPGVGVGGHNLVAAQRGPLRVEAVARVLQPKCVLRMDVQRDVGIKGAPNSLAGQPGRVYAGIVCRTN